MCTVVILFRPDHDWPVLLAANRDERRDRPWQKPGRHWPDRPEVVAGLDELAGGSWLGINESGLVAAVLNRSGTLGPEAGKRSRGELVLDALDFADARDAAESLSALDPRAYRPFNLVLADNRDVFLLAHRDGSGEVPIEPARLRAGLTMVTALDADDPRSPRTRFYRPRFLDAPTPDPDRGSWGTWESLLASRDHEPGSGLAGALYIEGMPPDDTGRFGTVSSSLIALPGIARPERDPIWRFTSGPPETTGWEEIGVTTRN